MEQIILTSMTFNSFNESAFYRLVENYRLAQLHVQLALFRTCELEQTCKGQLNSLWTIEQRTIESVQPCKDGTAVKHSCTYDYAVFQQINA
ncbi:MAG: hypothetical protein ACOVNZ_04450, partial [Crocinitomicaceae bacterium]